MQTFLIIVEEKKMEILSRDLTATTTATATD
jgi:hypothetical protein